MADTTLLKTSAIVRNATFAPPQHGPVKTGALPLVQVKMAPGGPQVQNGQQKAVEILPPRDAKSAVAIGGLPMVQVKMTQNGPQLDDGRDNERVVIKNAKHSGVATGGLPMLQVKMTQAGPQVQTLSTVQGGPPQIPAASPALSAPRGAPRAAPTRRVIAAPSRQVSAAPTRQVALPPVPDLSTDQLMLCRHLVEKYLGELRAVDAAVAGETSTGAENLKLAEETISTLDEVMIATAVRAAAAEEEAAAAPSPVAVLPTQTYAAATSIAPAPSASYVAGRVGARPQGFTAGARAQRNAGMAPRGVARGGSALPPVIVKMEGKLAVVQNQAEIAQAKAAMLAPEPTFPAFSPEATVAAEAASTAVSAEDNAQG